MIGCGYGEPAAPQRLGCHIQPPLNESVNEIHRNVLWEDLGEAGISDGSWCVADLRPLMRLGCNDQGDGLGPEALAEQANAGVELLVDLGRRTRRFRGLLAGKDIT